MLILDALVSSFAAIQKKEVANFVVNLIDSSYAFNSAFSGVFSNDHPMQSFKMDGFSNFGNKGKTLAYKELLVDLVFVLSNEQMLFICEWLIKNFDSRKHAFVYHDSFLFSYLFIFGDSKVRCNAYAGLMMIVVAQQSQNKQGTQLATIMEGIIQLFSSIRNVRKSREFCELITSDEQLKYKEYLFKLISMADLEINNLSHLRCAELVANLLKCSEFKNDAYLLEVAQGLRTDTKALVRNWFAKI